MASGTSTAPPASRPSRPGWQDGARALWFGTAYGLCVSVLRLAIFFHTGTQDLPRAAVGSLVRLPGNLVLGAILGALLFVSRLPRALRLSVAALFLALDIVALHYEGVFGELATPDELRFLSNLAPVGSSLATQGLAAVAQWLLGLAVLMLARRIIARRPPVVRRGSLVAWYVLFGGAAILATLLQIRPHLLGPQHQWAARHPIVWFATADPPPTPAGRAIGPEQVRRFQAFLGHRPPFATGDPRAPLCGPRPPLPTTSRPDAGPTSLTLIVLEGIGVAELEAEVAGRALMPSLRRIAAEGWSARRFHAVGTQTAQSFPALYAGQPGDTAGVLLWRKPLPHLEGFPAALARAGYRTAYLHGGDLSFEQQRQFLQMVGFQELSELDPLRPEAVVGWGYPDGDMLERLRDWIAAHRARSASAPFFVTLATLSTHHPYELPADLKRQPGGTPFHESVRYLDSHLGRFYDWWRTHELPRGALLAIVSDHAALLANTQATSSGARLDFRIPFVVVGRSLAGDPKQPAHADRLASQFDLPASLGGLLGIPPGPCDQGRNIFQSTRWPDQRIVYGVGGRRLSQIYLFTDRSSALVQVREQRLELLDFDGVSSGPLAETAAQHTSTLGSFVAHLLPIGQARFAAGSYALAPPPPSRRGPALPRVARPIVVSHQGNVSGFLPFEVGNRLPAVRAAVRAGFEWVEVDVNFSKDGVPVLLHDPTVTDGNGRELRVEDLTVAELRRLPKMADLATLEELIAAVGRKTNLCIELKPQLSIAAGEGLAHTVVRLLHRFRKEGALRDVIVDSFSLEIASSIKRHCACTVALDLPFQAPVTTAWLDVVGRVGIDWIYINETVATADAIRAAHARGLRVMVYTVNPRSWPALSARLSDELPDGIITDEIALSALLPAAVEE